jgi:phosphoserine aminotransferase
MLTLNVGPSKVTDKTKQDAKEACDKGILEISHRSEEFTRISKKAIEGLRKFYRIPKDYYIFYTSSATEAMELAIGNCCKKASFHFVDGNFSKQFKDVALRLNKQVDFDEVKWGKINDVKQAQIKKTVDHIAITHNATSTGAIFSMQDISYLRKKYPSQILTVDITSSAGVFPARIKEADIWFFSVQKGFGLPAGMGLIIVSPKAFQKSIKLEEQNLNQAGFFTFAKLQSKMEEKYQTPCTPNVFLIYLLAQKLERWNKRGGIQKNYQDCLEKYKLIEAEVSKNSKFKFFIKPKKAISYITPCIEADPKVLIKLHAIAKKNDLILGKGYGELKEKTFRIANFPSVKKSDIKKLVRLMNQA